MMRSMFSGVSGLRTHQTRMDVIAHNISNVNTIGFKSSRATFNDIFSQTVQGASRANDVTGRGGTNPMQIGLGVNVASIDRNMNTGAAQRTDRGLDLMINGDGFFIVGDATGTFFTRAGNFEIDEAGWLHMNGMRVMGWDRVPDPNAPGGWGIQRDLVQPIFLGGDKEQAPPTASTNIRVEGNLNQAAIVASGGFHTASKSFFDSLGNRWVKDITFTYVGNTTYAGPPPQDAAEWVVTFSDVAFLNGNRGVNAVRLNLDTPLPDITVYFDTNGRLIPGGGDLTNSSHTVTLDIDTPPVTTGLPLPGTPVAFPPFTIGAGGTGDFTFDFQFLTQFGSTTTNASFDTRDGNAPGILEGISVGSDGIITGRYSNGEMAILGQIPIARFRNPAGLESIGGNLFVTSPNSGAFNGTGEETGNIMGGVLEMSNVDLSNEFTEMITTQRGFQASSRIISTSDEMLQELVNLRR